MSWPARSSGAMYGGAGGRGYPAPSSGAGPTSSGGSMRSVPPPRSIAGPSSAGGYHSGGGGGHQSAPSSGGAAPPLVVSGCNDATVASLITGDFTASGTNHGKPVYKKQVPADSVSVLIYFWDDRDGPSFSGWWFGPKVGGDQVWAYNSAKASVCPPAAGWRVPWDGPLDDTLRVATAGERGGRSDPRAGLPPPPSASRSSRAAEDDDPRRRRYDDARADPRADPREARGGRGAEVDPRRARDDDRRREEDRRRREEEDRRRREEEDRRRREEEKRRRAEEEARKREEEARRRREREEEQRRREEAEKRRREEEAKRREQMAVMAVRRVIQKVRVSTPEAFDADRAELEDTLRKQLEAMGSNARPLSDEAQSTLKQAQRRIEEINQKRAEEERRRQEEERKRKEEAATVERLMREAGEFVTKCEAKVQEAESAATALADVKGATPETMMEAASSVQKVVDASKSEVQQASQWMKGKSQDLSDNHASRGQMMEFQDIVGKVDAARRSLEKLTEKATATREGANRKKAALNHEAERKSAFEKLDKDEDGELNRTEVIAFAQAVHGFELPEEVLAKVMGVLEPVTYDKFHALHRKIAMAKMEALARVKRAEQAARRKLLEEQRIAAQKVMDGAEKLLTAAEEKVQRADDECRAVVKDGELPAEQLKGVAISSQELAAAAMEELKSVLEQLSKAEADTEAVEELKGFGRREMARMHSRHERAQSRAERIASTAKRSLEQAEAKAFAELDEKLTLSVAAIHRRRVEQGKTAEEVFDEAAAGAAVVSRESFAKWVGELPDVKFSEGQAERLFDHVSEGDEASAGLGKDRFLDITRLFYKCVKGTVANQELSIKSKAVRRLEVGEVLEAVEGPATEPGASLRRVKCKPLGDGGAGWVTIEGNQGTAFLQQYGNFLLVRKERKEQAERAAKEAEKAAEAAQAEEAPAAAESEDAKMEAEVDEGAPPEDAKVEAEVDEGAPPEGEEAPPAEAPADDAAAPEGDADDAAAPEGEEAA